MSDRSRVPEQLQLHGLGISGVRVGRERRDEEVEAEVVLAVVDRPGCRQREVGW